MCKDSRAYRTSQIPLGAKRLGRARRSATPYTRNRRPRVRGDGDRSVQPYRAYRTIPDDVGCSLLLGMHLVLTAPDSGICPRPMFEVMD